MNLLDVDDLEADLKTRCHIQADEQERALPTKDEQRHSVARRGELRTMKDLTSPPSPKMLKCTVSPCVSYGSEASESPYNTLLSHCEKIKHREKDRRGHMNHRPNISAMVVSPA